jgi:hypothetical protein
MQLRDVQKCAEIIAAHPVIGARYGRAIQYLRPAWSRLLDCGAKTATLFEDGEGSRATICSVGVSVFVSDDFIRELKTTPFFWFGPELAIRLARGSSPLLSDRDLRECNSCGGLNLLVWEGWVRPEFAGDADVHRAVMNSFLAQHSGFRWKEVISSQLESAERLEWTVNSGGLIWDPRKAQYVDLSELDAEEIVRKPHLVGLSLDVEVRRKHAWAGSWVGALFDYHPPQFGFSPSEQRLLVAALAAEGGTDRDLAETLYVSLPTIKKMWVSIYRRVAEQRPEIIPDYLRVEQGGPDRGKEKRRPLLAYLRTHPEELRPASKRLLTQNRFAEKAVS